MKSFLGGSRCWFATPTEIFKVFCTPNKTNGPWSRQPLSFLRCLRTNHFPIKSAVIFAGFLSSIKLPNHLLACLLIVTFHENLGVTPPNPLIPVNIGGFLAETSESGEVQRLQNSFHEDKVYKGYFCEVLETQTPRFGLKGNSCVFPKKNCSPAAGLSMLPKDSNHWKNWWFYIGIPNLFFWAKKLP